MYDDDTGYDLDDPKHPTFHERMSGRADLDRKRDKEDAPDPDLWHQENDEEGMDH